jgi:hypothetical protein
MEKKLLIKIRKGRFELNLERDRLISVDPTYDGIVFNFQEGLYLTCTDPVMPNSSKELIKNSTNSFPKATLIIDLANYVRPISAEVE